MNKHDAAEQARIIHMIACDAPDYACIPTLVVQSIGAGPDCEHDFKKHEEDVDIHWDCCLCGASAVCEVYD